MQEQKDAAVLSSVLQDMREEVRANATTSTANATLSCITASKEAIKTVSNFAEQMKSQTLFTLSSATVEAIDSVVASIEVSTNAIDKNQSK
jgi:hypothetical protein